MPELFESYDDLDDADERLEAADPAERRVAIISLGHSGDPAAVAHLAGMVSDHDAGVRQQVTAWPNSRTRPLPTPFCRWSRMLMPSSEPGPCGHSRSCGERTRSSQRSTPCAIRTPPCESRRSA